MKLNYEFDYKKEPLLTPAEEIELTKLIKAGMAANATQLEQKRGIRAKRRMVRANMRWIITLASAIMRKHRPVSLTLEDLVQEGVLGLNRAVELFDYTRGYKFSTYSEAWIKQSIRRAIAFQDRIIRLPVHIQEEVYRFRRTSEVHGASMNTQQIMQAANVSQKTLEMAAVSNGLISYNTTATANNDGTELCELIASKTEITYLDEMGWDAEKINQLLAVLDEKERSVICWHYGLNGMKQISLAKMAAKLRISKERVSQINRRAHMKLRNNINSQTQII